MVRDELSVLAAFLTVAEERSFTRAAKRLDVSPSALSHAVRDLDEHLGVRLLARTTRSVAQCRWRHVQPLRRPREAALLGHGEERRQDAELVAHHL